MRRRTFLFTLLSALPPLTGCSRAKPREARPLLQKKAVTDVIAIVYDCSGSYEAVMRERAYPASLKMLRDFRRATAGDDGTKVILAQISSDPDIGPFFDGTLADFGKKLGTADKFRERLQKYGGGSPVYDSVRQTADYMAGFVGPESRACLVVLSDMEDNDPNPEREAKLMRSLTALADKGASCAFLWVGKTEVAKWDRNLAKAGFKHYACDAVIAESVTLPRFER